MTIDSKLEELGDRLERSAAADLRSEQPAPGAVKAWARQRRSRLLASSSLGLAGIGPASISPKTSSSSIALSPVATSAP